MVIYTGSGDYIWNIMFNAYKANIYYDIDITNLSVFLILHGTYCNIHVRVFVLVFNPTSI